MRETDAEVEVLRVQGTINAELDFIEARYASGQAVFGWEVDDVCRAVVEKAGYGRQFVHRTGHSIGEDVHWSGVNIDNLETRDDRQLVPGVCFSIEPGIYLPDEGLGVRTEIDVFLADDGPRVFSKIQREIVKI